MKKVYLVTGGNGYLMSHLLPHLKQFENTEFILLPNNLDIANKEAMDEYRDFLYGSVHLINGIIHFASPSTNEDFYRSDAMRTLIDGTINIINLAKFLGAKLIFASTYGVYDIETEKMAISNYSLGKLTMERYIQDQLADKQYLILRIPRVYSIDRKKGLISKLKNGKKMDNEKLIKHIIFIDEFIKQTLPQLNLFIFHNHNFNIYEYENTEIYSIKEIKNILKIP
jgi:nucleoside-diphosphate-sugar epimerase